MSPNLKRAIGIGALALATAATVLAASLPAQAATLFADNFNDGNHNGWSSSGGSWQVAADGSASVLEQRGASTDARLRGGPTGLVDTAVTVRVKPRSFNGANRFVGIGTRASSSGNYYFLALRADNTVVLGKRAGGTSTILATAPVTVSTGTWYTLRLQASGPSLSGTVNGGTPLTGTDGGYTAGQVALLTSFATAAFDDVLVESAPSGPSPSTSPSSSPTVSPTVPPSPTPTSPTPTSTGPTGDPVPPVPGQVDGWASVIGLGQGATTGGAGGTTVTVDTTAEFIEAIARTGPTVVQVSGTITLPTGTSDGMYNVSSDKTIVGLGRNATLTGGGLNIGLPVDDAIVTPPAGAVHNVIIRNLSITGASDDLINVQMFSHHIWIDHNSLSNGGDGAVDIKRGSDYVTVSWNRFFDHDKTLLLGHDDANGAQDIGRLRVTYHHNFFDGSDQRNPRVRFSASTHVYNNYYDDNSYGVASTNDAAVLVENNYFFSVNNPGRVVFSGPEGRIVERGNILVDCNHPIETRGTVPEPSQFYSYRLDHAAVLPTLIPAGAGAGKLG